ncbi:hypothetical protein ACU6S6_19410, partial [Acinetobacter baumannii]|uniref:hypothetical protein n=1 Tax=Acinetobacter baumannii TaxID=470 RepID=UPI00406C1DE1
ETKRGERGWEDGRGKRRKKKERKVEEQKVGFVVQAEDGIRGYAAGHVGSGMCIRDSSSTILLYIAGLNSATAFWGGFFINILLFTSF